MTGVRAKPKKLYTDLAYLLASILSPVEASQPGHSNIIESVNYFRSEKPIKKLSCKFKGEENFKYCSDLAVLQQLNRPGLVSSLCMPYFLRSSHHNIDDIVYDEQAKTFFYIGREYAFKRSKIVSLLDAREDKEFNPDDLFLSFSHDPSSNATMHWLDEEASKRESILLERNIAWLRYILLPIDTIKENISPYYAVSDLDYDRLKQQQSKLTLKMLLNADFRRFLFSVDMKKQAQHLHAKIIKTLLLENISIKDINLDAIKNKSDNFSTSEKLAKYILYLDDIYCSEKEKEKAIIVKTIMADLQAPEEKEEDSSYQYLTLPSKSASLDEIEKAVLSDASLLPGSKKDLLVESIATKIATTETLEGVFQIVEELKKPEHDAIRKRDYYSPFSLTGSAIKHATGEIEPTGERFAQLMRLAKVKMLQIGKKNKVAEDEHGRNNSIQTLKQTKKYREFLLDHVHGFWFGYDTFLQYVMPTQSAQELAKLTNTSPTPAEEQKRQYSPVSSETTGSDTEATSSPSEEEDSEELTEEDSPLADDDRYDFFKHSVAQVKKTFAGAQSGAAKITSTATESKQTSEAAEPSFQDKILEEVGAGFRDKFASLPGLSFLKPTASRATDTLTHDSDQTRTTMRRTAADKRVIR